MYKEVKDFMVACDQTKNDVEQAELYLKLCREELKELYEADTAIDALDAYCDLAWVLTGYFISKGMDRETFDLKFFTTLGSIIDTIREKDLADLNVLASVVSSLNNTAYDDIQNVDDLMRATAICTLVPALYGWDFAGAFKEVARSNMAKVDSTTGKVMKREDGKVMKPTTWTPPNLELFLKK